MSATKSHRIGDRYNVPVAVRKRLRREIGSRTTRRSGVKSMTVGKSGRPAAPSTRMKEAIIRYKRENA